MLSKTIMQMAKQSHMLSSRFAHYRHYAKLIFKRHYSTILVPRTPMREDLASQKGRASANASSHHELNETGLTQQSL